MLLSYSHIAPEAESVVELGMPNNPQIAFPQNQGVVCEAVIMVNGRTHSFPSTVIIKSFEDFLTDTACGNKTETAPLEDVTVAFVRWLAVGGCHNLECLRRSFGNGRATRQNKNSGCCEKKISQKLADNH